MKKDNLWRAGIVVFYAAYLIGFTCKAFAELNNIKIDYEIANSIFLCTKYAIAVVPLLFVIAMWISVCKGRRQMRHIIRNWVYVNVVSLLLLLIYALVFHKIFSIDLLYPMVSFNGLLLFLMACVWFRESQLR